MRTYIYKVFFIGIVNVVVSMNGQQGNAKSQMMPEQEPLKQQQPHTNQERQLQVIQLNYNTDTQKPSIPEKQPMPERQLKYSQKTNVQMMTKHPEE
ncbi:MAG TPA: hypothetical protein VGW78_02955 [Candidatus Babeliales bacterium]|jgi:hypothetical protein|nr:hypothetical protein [Candidatus Babeliales bacterium]